MSMNEYVTDRMQSSCLDTCMVRESSLCSRPAPMVRETIHVLWMNV